MADRAGRGEWRTGQAAVSMAPGGRRVRPAAVAGRFYPGDARALREQVRHLLDAVTVPDDEPPAAAYVVPHAGYRYSGPTAAHVYARLRAAAGGVDRVVLAGPAHHLPVRGCVVPTVERWATPLGEQVVDVAGARALVAAGWAVAGDAPHAPEHSLEVQVPFLQEVLRPGVPLLPVVVGPDEVVLSGGPPACGPELDPAPLLAAVGLGAADLDGAPRRAGCGIDFTYLPVREEAVARAVSDTAALRALPLGTGLSVTAYAAGAAHSRVFVPEVGVAEDPATGSAAVGLGVFLAASGALGDGEHAYVVRQGAELGRPSTLGCTVRVEGGAATATTVAGGVVPVARGEVRRPDR